MFIGILELALVMLSHDQLEVSLPTTKEFFNQFLSVLMTYATEGTYPLFVQESIITNPYMFLVKEWK